MNANIIRRNKYSIYCREHLSEFKNALRDEATKALSSWPGRTAALLLVVASIITYLDATSRGNPVAMYTLFTYIVTVAIIILYPVISLVFSSIEKISPLVLDFTCISGLIGFCYTVFLVFHGAVSQEDYNSLYLELQGQIAFVLALTSAFSFHSTFIATFARNALFLLVTVLLLYFINTEFLILNGLVVFEGFVLGLMIGWVFHDGIRTRFYLKSTDADTRQHLYDQLSKLVYPHQLERIKLGDQLENTMPQKEGKAIVNVFDVQKSSEIKHENTKEFFMGVFQSFLQICMDGYEHNPLRSRAFRLKETGDGFISTVGYPFLPIESRSLADSAVSTALDMFEMFNEEVKKFNYSRPIKGAMGLAYNSVQGTFQSGGIRAYDLFGDALIQAARYEEIRKNPVIAGAIKDHAKDIGLEHYHIIIVQEVIYNSLSDNYRNLFVEVDVETDYFKEQNFQLLYDTSARFIYFHIRD